MDVLRPDLQFMAASDGDEAQRRRWSRLAPAPVPRLRAWSLTRMRKCLGLARTFGPFALRSGLEWRRGELAEPAAQATRAAELRRLLEAAGPTFIKLGQALASRPDLLPAPALRELLQLCDQCPAFDWELARAVLAEGLRAEPGQVFGGVGGAPRPVSAASLGQVYRWEYGGRDVAVKVQRPDLRHAVSLDLYLIRGLAVALRAVVRRLTRQRTDHVMLVDVWAAGTWSELDYLAEGGSQEQFKEALEALMPGRLYIPEVVWEVTSSKVLVTEWVEGPKLAACSPEVVQKLVPVGIECFCLQLLELGIFHSDPHPGNILVRDGQLVLIDFGLVARIDRPDMNRLTFMTVHLISGDYVRLFDDLVALGFLPSDADRESIVAVLSKVLDLTVQAGSDMRARAKNFKTVSDDLNQIFFELPFELALLLGAALACGRPGAPPLLTRAILTLEGIAMAGDESFDIFQAAYPFALRQARGLLLRGDAAASAGLVAGALALASATGAEAAAAAAP
ncbi:unnamed protein product [Prorocentrum cordatum]|uniref:Protein kinase domain-containing protein n=1 Tax=Prorocentrum cordatum TaxID=2364126 RepID=A0ABN9WH81_9DINO|nr:unnamed protein product [Polarella glacialis]